MSQQAHNIKMMSYQRQCYVITSHRRWYDIILTLCAHWGPFQCVKSDADHLCFDFSVVITHYTAACLCFLDFWLCHYALCSSSSVAFCFLFVWIVFMFGAASADQNGFAWPRPVLFVLFFFFFFFFFFFPTDRFKAVSLLQIFILYLFHVWLFFFFFFFCHYLFFIFLLLMLCFMIVAFIGIFTLASFLIFYCTVKQTWSRNVVYLVKYGGKYKTGA